MPKAIVSTSASPFHFGHLELYRAASKLFGVKNVTVAIGKNYKKNCDLDQINFHMIPYKIPFELADNITLSDYCEKNSIKYIVRGIRDSKDTDYELMLSYINKELKSDLKTIFFPTDERFRNISSSLLNELLRYEKFGTIKKFMNEDAMYRFFYKKPEFVVFFGKSCSGKTSYISKKYSNNFVNVDSIFWDIFSLCFGKKEMELVKKLSYEAIYSKNSLDKLIDKYSTDEFWSIMFSFVKDNYKKTNYTDKNLNYSGYILDFPSIGCYWKKIKPEIRSRFYLVKLETDNNKRKSFIAGRKMESKINYLDYNYRDPEYFDKIVTI